MPARDSSRATLGLDRLARLFARARARFPRAAAGAIALLPALLAGYQLSILTLFLNPQLEPGLARLAAGTARGALLLAPLSLAAHWLATRRRRVRVARLLPWSFTVVLVAAALSDWVHASRWSFYLAPALGANLIKLALWLSLGAIAAFYTALLHTVHHRAYGPRSVALLVFVALASVWVGHDRRTSYRATRDAVVFPAASPAPAAPQLVVVFVDGATLDVLLPLARQSRLPFFAELFEAGASARLATAAPVEPLAANATLATGKLPYRHGLLAAELVSSAWLPPGELRLAPLGFRELALAGGAGRRRAARAADRQARAVWEIVAAAGAKTALLGFPAALEDEPALDAVASAERFADAPAGTARPAALDGRIALLAGAGRELPPALAAIDGAPAPVVRDAFARDAWRLALAESLLAADERFDQIYLSLPGLLAVELATRGGFEAVELEGARGREARAAADALTAYAATLDSALARLWQRMRAPRALALVSAFGVDRPQGFVRRLGGTTAGAPDGAFWLLGEGVARPGAALPAARIVDVAPTLLYVAGLPIARDFDGRVLTEALEPALLQRQPLAFVPTWGRNEPR